MLFANPRAGSKVGSRPSTLSVFRRGADFDSFDTITLTTAADLTSIAHIDPMITTSKDGVIYQTGQLITIDLIVTSSSADTAAALFRLTGGLYADCVNSDASYLCTFVTPRRVTTVPPASIPPAVTTHEAPLAVGTTSSAIPICSGTVVDGGFGKTTVISLADVACDAPMNEVPVRLAFDKIFTPDDSFGIPYARDDGTIVYNATEAASGHYVALQAWAVTADGTTSFPFSVVIRNRYAPQSVQPAAIDAIRSVDTTIPRATLFTDKDVDVYGTDHVTVQTTDAFGLQASETVEIHIGDVVPDCETGGATTDAGFSGTNNGASRASRFTVDVLAVAG